MERRCFKWVRITHLSTWNISYGQKRGRELNWQFDSQPLKVKNCPDFLVCRWHATYRWKVLDEGYNFVLNLTSIRDLRSRAPKVMEVQTLRILRLPLGSRRTKWHLGVSFMARHRVYYKGEGGGLPPSSGHGESCESIFAYGSSVHQRCSNSALTNLLFGFCRFVWVSDLFVNLPSPIPELQHTLYPEVLRARERTPTASPFVVFFLDSKLSPSKSFGCVTRTQT